MNDFREKSFDELCVLFEEAVQNFGVKTQEEQDKVKAFDLALGYRDEEIKAALDSVRTEHFFFRDGDVSCKFVNHDKVWSKDRYVEVEKELIHTPSFSYRLVDCIEDMDGFSHEKVFKRFQDKTVSGFTWLFANYTEDFSIGLIITYWQELDSLLKAVDETLMDEVISILRKYEGIRIARNGIINSWRERREAPADIFSAAKSAWWREHPLESHVGERIFCHTKGYSAIIESVSDNWVKFTDGTKCKRENVDSYRLIMGQDWAKAMNAKVMECRDKIRSEA